MKTLTILFILLFVGVTSQAQEAEIKNHKAKVGLYYSSFGDIAIMGDDLMGAPGNLGDNFYTIGFTYLKPLNNWLDLETGIDWSKHKVIHTPNFIYDQNPDPSFISSPIEYKETVSIINIPVTVRANFLKYFYANGGMFIGLDVSKDSPIESQGGIGALVGLGAKYDFKCGATIFVNPYTKFHSLVGFEIDDNRKRIYESGVKIGFAFGI